MHGTDAKGAIGHSAGWAAKLGFAAVIFLGIVLHWLYAEKRSSALLEHDEAITLLAAAGKSDRIDGLYASLDRLQIRKASDLQALLRPTGDTGFGDVWNSVVHRDVHPPLYFWLLHAVQRLTSATPQSLRAIGFLAMLAAAIVADRWIWPNASLLARLAAFGMLIAGPVWLELATELRQYAIVTLGTVLTIAALAKLDRGESTKTAAAVIGVAGAALVWTHLGSIAWVSIVLLLALWLTAQSGWRHARWTLVAAVATVVLLLPLLLADWNQVVTGRAAASDVSLTSAMQQSAAMARSVTQAFLPLPRRFDGAAVSIVVSLTLALLAAWFAKGNGRLDRGLLVGAVLWTLAWLVGLAMGKIPEHAAEPKYLMPLLLALLAVVVRTSASQVKSKRTAATAILIVAVVASPVGWWQRLMMPTDGKLLATITGSPGLLVDQPKRGQLLPIVAKMMPESDVIIATPEVALANLGEWKRALPVDELLVLEMNAATSARTEEFERLRMRYVSEREIHSGPARRLTKFEVRRNSPNR